MWGWVYDGDGNGSASIAEGERPVGSLGQDAPSTHPWGLVGAIHGALTVPHLRPRHPFDSALAANGRATGHADARDL